LGKREPALRTNLTNGLFFVEARSQTRPCSTFFFRHLQFTKLHAEVTNAKCHERILSLSLIIGGKASLVEAPSAPINLLGLFFLHLSALGPLSGWNGQAQMSLLERCALNRAKSCKNTTFVLFRHMRFGPILEFSDINGLFCCILMKYDLFLTISDSDDKGI